MSMTWTTEQPTVIGWYWYRTPRMRGRAILLCVLWHAENLHEDPALIAAHYEESKTYPLHMLNGEWCGPLEAPQ